jgi:serine/threonine-protein kinase
LLELEQLAIDAQVWFETEAGLGEVLFAKGKIVAARLGGARGKAALLRLVTISDGKYGIKRGVVASGPPIVRSVEALVELRLARDTEWVQLCSTAPPLSSVLTLTAEGRMVRDSARGIQRLVLVLVDGGRTLMQLLEESSFEPIDTLKAITQAIRNDWVRVAPPATSLFPLSPMTNGSEIQESDPSTPFVQSDTAFRRLPANPLTPRRATLNGLGLNDPILAPAPIITIADEVEPVQVSPPPESILPLSSRPTFDAESLKHSERRNIDRYEILLRLGRGRASTVYLARRSASELGFRRLYALKLLNDRLNRDGQRRFLASASAAANIQHANVVSVHDAGLHEGQAYVVVDYVEGCALDSLIRGTVGASPYLILPIVIDALTGLQAVHSLQDELGLDRSQVQCDISLRNIIVGTDGTCRLTDFRFASQARQFAGSDLSDLVGYVAPECVSGHPIDHRADIFSMGVVLWNSLTGQRLFPGETQDEVLANVCTRPIQFPSFVGARSSPALDEIVMRALARNPLDRFGSAEAMLTALGRVATSIGGMATPKEIASWVRQAVGKQLTQRRLAILDASREDQTVSPPAVETSAVGQSGPLTHSTQAPAQQVLGARTMGSPQPSVASVQAPRSEDAPEIQSAPAEIGPTVFYGKDDYVSLTASKRFGVPAAPAPQTDWKSKFRISTPWALVALLALVVSIVNLILTRMVR